MTSTIRRNSTASQKMLVRANVASPEKKEVNAAGYNTFIEEIGACTSKLFETSDKVYPLVLSYNSKGVDDFVNQVSIATPLQLVDVERKGVSGRFLKDLSKRLKVPAARVFKMLGVPKATAEKKAASGEVVSGSGGQAAIGMAKLLGAAQAIVANSTAAEAQDFDSAAWLGLWLERPQPSLGGLKPADLIDTPTGIKVVTRLLGAIESGAYQ